MARTRIRTVLDGEGSAQRLRAGGVTSTTSSSPYSRSTVVDLEGARDNAFTVNHFYKSGAQITHTWTQDPFVPIRKVLKAFTPSYFETANGWSHLNDPSLPSLSSLAVTCLKRTNPSAPYVDIPVALLELRELPDLVRKFGNGAFKRIAEGNLRWEFGVRPVVSDLLKLVSFQDKVNKRIELLKKLKEGSLLRKVALYDSVVSTTPGSFVTTNSHPDFTCSHFLDRKTTSRKVWGYVRWKPNVSDFKGTSLSDERIKYTARRIILGASPDASTLWNALPWSWLADWFGNMGDYLEAHRSLIPVSASIPRICQTTITTEYYSLRSSNFGLTVGQHQCSRILVTKSRSLASASFPSAEMPLLSGRQLGILSSLAALRSR